MHRLWTRRPFRFSCSTWSSRQSSLRWLATADRHPTCGQQHLVWTVLDAVAELDLLAVYADYRDDGAASPPTDDGAALARRYARGNRSSRGIEWACMADVAYRVVTGTSRPFTRRSPGSAAGTNSRCGSCSPTCSGRALARGWCRVSDSEVSANGSPKLGPRQRWDDDPAQRPPCVGAVDRVGQLKGGSEPRAVQPRERSSAPQTERIGEE